MKKIYTTIIIVIIIFVAIYFYPKKISLGGGFAPIGAVQHYQKCNGFYKETYNYNATDGDRGGLCFGNVTQY